MARVSDVVFACFDDVIKTPDIKILEAITTTYYKEYKDLINMNRVKDKPRDYLDAFLIKRRHENILDELMIKPFNTMESYLHLYENIKSLYIGKDFLDFSKALEIMNLRDDISQIYIWEHKKDPRKSIEIEFLYGLSDKTQHIDGPFTEAIRKTQPTLIVINSLRYLKGLVDNNLCSQKTILMPIYFYNSNITKKGIVPRLDGIEEDVLKQGGILLHYLPKKGFKKDAFTPEELESLSKFSNTNAFSKLKI